ncbi:amidohydrolase family protein [Planctomycetaceae bacterium SH139]
MLRFFVLTGLLAGSFVCGGRAEADEPQRTAFVGGRLIPVDGPEIPDGVLLIQGDKIEEVGSRGEVSIPPGTRLVDVSGQTIMPGLVCTHSHIGGVGAADRSGPIQPGVRVMDSVNVRDPGFKRALAGGLTSLNIMPGSGHLMSGQTIYVKLRWGAGMPKTIEDIAYTDAQGDIMGGLKMANGTNSIGDAPFPGTRGKSAYLVREKYLKAQEYRDKIRRAGDDASALPPRDLDLETLVEVLEGKRIIHHHTHRADDIMTVLRLKSEFGFRVVLHHVSEAWKIPSEIAAADVPCSVILVDSPGGKLEARHLLFKTGRVLEEANVQVAFHTDDWITDSRVFFRMAALGIRAGMSREKALEALTIVGAKMIDLDDSIGTLTPGKDADFVILSGDPFSVYTKVLETWVEGTRAFDRSDPRDELFAEGGFGAGSETEPYMCCISQGVSQ